MSRLKPTNQWTGNFKYFLIDLGTAVLFDSDMDLPIVFGNKVVVDVFITRFVPKESIIQYYSRKHITKSWQNLSFALDYVYEGVSSALKGESQTVIEKQGQPKISENT